MKQRTNQGGSVISFVIVGVVLAAVIAGGVYLVNQRSKQHTNQPSTSQPPTSTNKDEPSTNPTSGTATPQPSPSQSTPSTGANQSQNGHLPQSGPADGIFQIIALSVLIGCITAYTRSQTHKRQIVSL